jgi:uncharacterized membrane protein
VPGMIASHIEPILLVSGLFTTGAIAVFFVPGAAVRLVFGADVTWNAALLIARHWGLVVSLIGCLIVYAAYHPLSRTPFLVAASVEKAILIALFAIGGVRWTPGMRVVAAADGLFTLLYVAYLGGL